MAGFLSEDFLLSTDAAKKLYHEHAERAPVMDYHCHINPREIWEDRRFDNLTQVWLGGDHYKWRLMRSAGVDERHITGDAPDRDKFQQWAEVLGRAIGNPLYHWSHLELKRFFGYDGALNGYTADAVWNLANEKLQDLSVRRMILMSNVTHICTTDDPVDSLEWHKKLLGDASFPVSVLPAWRPDRAMSLEKPDFLDYLEALSDASGAEIGSFEGLKAALCRRMDFFHENGCRLSDHALEYVYHQPATDAEIEKVFRARLAGRMPDPDQARAFKTAFLLFAGREYAKRGWAMQLHCGCKRDNNRLMYDRLGPDSGFDAISNFAPSAQMADLLNALAVDQMLPRTVIYSLNPADDPVISSIIGCFQGAGVAGKIQHGSAWWFNDHIDGMTRQIKTAANLGYLAGFVGMLTDSRSFLSYPRHEYFRRILCAILGEWVEQGAYPEDYDTLGQIVRGICYDNALGYFQFLSKP